MSCWKFNTSEITTHTHTRLSTVGVSIAISVRTHVYGVHVCVCECHACIYAHLCTDNEIRIIKKCFENSVPLNYVTADYFHGISISNTRTNLLLLHLFLIHSPSLSLSPLFSVWCMCVCLCDASLCIKASNSGKIVYSSVCRCIYRMLRYAMPMRVAYATHTSISITIFGFSNRMNPSAHTHTHIPSPYRLRIHWTLNRDRVRPFKQRNSIE